MKHGLLILFLFISVSLFAQEKKLIKAKAQYEDARYEKALKTMGKVLSHKDTKNNPEALLLHAKILVKLADNPEYPKALLDALKSTEKALRKSKKPETLRADESEFFATLLEQCMLAANADLKDQRYIQSDKYFNKIYELYGSMPAKWGQARVALSLKDTSTALQISRELVNRLMTEKNAPSLLSETGPFVLLINHQILLKTYDSAAYYAERANDLYPQSSELKQLLLRSFLLHVTSSKPELNTLESFAAMRPRFKADSLFIHKENVLFLYLMNRYSAGDEGHISDSLLAGYISVKNGYYREFGNDYWQKDPMYDPNNNELIFKLIRYTARFERSYMLAMLLDNYVGGNYADSSFVASTRPQRWQSLFKRVKEEKSIFLLASSLNAATKELKNEKWYASYKRTELENALTNSSNFTDRIALYNFIPFVLEEYPKDRSIYTKTQGLSLSLIKEYTDSAWFSYARLSIKQHDQYFPQNDALKSLKKKFVTEDFKANYYGSRLLKKEVNGQQVSEFIWNGNDLLCDAGTVPNSIHDKVEQRINYFRRAAGVPDYVKLDTAKNEACQKAALIYQVNTGKMFTEPAITWKCYYESAVDAAQLSARVFGQTTVFAVTSIMADQGDANISVGNRRWLLFPAARNMGHGSTNKVALIWTLDDGGDKDTTEFMEDFVSWPPRDYCPSMFAFPRWNFSLYADLSKAKVSMTADGKPLEIVQEKQVTGYGMPTLVWVPKFEPVEGKTYTVTVQGVLLHGEKKARTYTYTVEFINPMK